MGKTIEKHGILLENLWKTYGKPMQKMGKAMETLHI